MMSRRSLLSLAPLSALVAACSPLGALNGLNGLTPGDGGVTRLVDGAAFGAGDDFGGVVNLIHILPRQAVIAEAHAHLITRGVLGILSADQLGAGSRGSGGSTCL